MAKKNDPLTLLKIDRRQAIRMASDVGAGRTLKVLRLAQAELNRRLKKIDPGGRDGTFTATQMRTTLAQLRVAIASVNGGIRETVLDVGNKTAERAVQHMLEYVHRADQKFTGVGQRLAIREARMLDRASRGTESSMLNRLQGDPNKGPGILQRYGDRVIGRFEERLQIRFLAKTPWADVRNELVAESPFLEEAPGYWAERIVRTEVMNAHNAAQWEGLRAVNQEVGGGMLKILSATFDSRTAADSYAVHGQIRRPHEAFETWYGFMQHPPARPNDREVVVPHSMDWPLPSELEQLSDSEVATRWAEEGRKKAMPPRPLMTTVPLERIGVPPSSAPDVDSDDESA